MLLKGAEIARYLARPDPSRPGLLVYGQDAMRVAMKRAEAIKALVGQTAELRFRPVLALLPPGGGDADASTTTTSSTTSTSSTSTTTTTAPPTSTGIGPPLARTMPLALASNAKASTYSAR